MGLQWDSRAVYARDLSAVVDDLVWNVLWVYLDQANRNEIFAKEAGTR